MIGGPFFYHALFTEGRTVIVRWAWPVPELNPGQWAMVHNYGRVRLIGWFRSWFPARNPIGKKHV
jgi:hypothetical protein